MIDHAVSKLVTYALRTGLIEACETTWAINTILDVLKLDSYTDPGEAWGDISLSEVLDELDLDTEHPQKTWELNKEFMTELLQYAKAQDVTICLENLPMGKFSMAHPEQILKFVLEMNDDHFKICLDTGHANLFPDVSLGDMVRKMGKQIRVLHVHDNMGDRDFHLWPTKGIIDWSGFMQALKDIDFQGVFSLETAPDKNLEVEPYAQAFKELCRLAKEVTQMV